MTQPIEKLELFEDEIRLKFADIGVALVSMKSYKKNVDTLISVG